MPNVNLDFPFWGKFHQMKLRQILGFVAYRYGIIASAPPIGLEPITTRLTVECSAN
jgi:hypothetical protein